jgi:hypothetical protein
MSESPSPPVPQPLVYLIHDDQDRSVADAVARYLSASGQPSWCRGQRAPKGQGADVVLKKARAAVLVLTGGATQSQLVRVDLTRGERENLPLVRLLIDPKAAQFATEYPQQLGVLVAENGLDQSTLEALEALLRPVTARHGLARAFAGKWRSRSVTPDASAPANETSDADMVRLPRPTRPDRPKSPAQTTGDAAGIGMRLTLRWLAPALVLAAASIGAVGWWWNSLSTDTQAQQAQQRVAKRAPLPASMTDLAANRLIEASASNPATKRLPPGIKRAGYEAEATATDTQIADAAEKLEVSKIARSAFKTIDGKRTCDVQVFIANKSADALPVVALVIGVRDKANLNLDERVLKVERRWVGPGASRVIEGQLSDLPKWAQTISVKVSPTKS